jgi:hypothetical protein
VRSWPGEAGRRMANDGHHESTRTHMARTYLTPVGSLADSPAPHGDEAHMSRRALEGVVWKPVSRLNRWAGIMASQPLTPENLR